MKNLVVRLAERLDDDTTYSQLQEVLREDLWNHIGTLKILWYLEVANVAQQAINGPVDHSMFRVVIDAITTSVSDPDVPPLPENELLTP